MRRCPCHQRSRPRHDLLAVASALPASLFDEHDLATDVPVGMQRRRVDGSIDGIARTLDDGDDALEEVILGLRWDLLGRSADQRVLGWNRAHF